MTDSGVLRMVGRTVLRPWRRRPVMAATVVVTLAVTIAGAAATFGLVQSVLLRPLPFADPDRLVRIFGVRTPPPVPPAVPIDYGRAGVQVETWRALQQSSVFSGVGAWTTRPQVVLEDTKELVTTLAGSSNLLDVLGVSPALGRAFTPEDESSATNAVMIGHRLWQTRFGGTADVLGQWVTLRLTFGVERKQIVGVLPSGFTLEGRQVDVLVSFNGDRVMAMDVVGRLEPDAPVAAAVSVAQSSINVSARGRPFETARVVPLSNDERRVERGPLLLQFGGAGILLLIACSSIGVLLHQEVQRRSQDIVIRASLGAGPFAAVAPLAAGFAGLAAAAVLAAIPLSWGGSRLLFAVLPLALAADDVLHATDAAFRFVLLAGGAAAALPVISAIGAALGQWRSSSLAVSGGQARITGRVAGQRLVVGLQLALAFVLVVAAGLFGETLIRITSQPVGFNPGRLLLVSTISDQPLLARHIDNPDASAVLEALAALPGVVSAAITSAAPLRGAAVSTPLEIPRLGSTRAIEQRVVSSGYFRTAGVLSMAGETFTERAEDDAAVVSQALAREFFDGDAVGRSFTVRGADRYRIIGVVPDVKVNGPRERDFPIFYTLTGPMYGRTDYLVRTQGDPSDLFGSARRIVSEREPGTLVTATLVMDDVLDSLVREERFRASLASWFAGLAVVLGGIALYGVTRSRAESRSREFGLRIALGATAADVRRLVLRDATMLVVWGLVLGLPVAAVFARIARALVFGVSPEDPHTYLLAATVLAAVALCAALEPAMRAARVSPTELLKD